MVVSWKILVAACVLVASSAWAEPNMVYPWDAPGPAPSMDCLDVPCVPCVLSLPGLTGSRCKTPADGVAQVPAANAVEEPTIAVVATTLPGLRPPPARP